MLMEMLLNTRLVNSYLKKSVERYLNKDLTDEARVIVDKINVTEENGYFSARIEANVDITKEAAKALMGF
jgi:hypothetical protein